MPTYWDEFYREFMHRLQRSVPEIVMLEAFWHYCNKGRDKCIAILNSYAALESGAQPPQADNTGSLPCPHFKYGGSGFVNRDGHVARECLCKHPCRDTWAQQAGA